MSAASVKISAVIDHIGMTVPDLDAAIALYIDAFGGEVLYEMGPFDSREMPPGPKGDWTGDHIDVKDAALRFKGVRIAGGVQLEIYEYARPSGRKDGPANHDIGGHHIALKVTDLAGATERLKSKGFRIMDGLIDPPDGPLLGSKSQYLVDPWGNYFELTQYDRMAFMNA